MSVQRAGVLTLAGVLASAGAFAEQGALGETYGTSALTVSTTTVFDCDTFSQADTWQPVVGTPHRFLTNGGLFMCGVFLPSGALIIRIDIEACDTSNTGQVDALLVRAASPGGTSVALAAVATGAGATPGCARFSTTLGTPDVVDNQTRKYFFQVATGNTAATAIAAVRVYYRLQVSPAPGAATFTDVPTSHPFFRFVEALVASGITGGCGGGLYCPDDPITRAQMAVFLATALGLHFSP
jgi:hypothetical protein